VLELIGFAAAFIGAMAFLPQVIKTWRTGSSEDLAWGMLGALLTAASLWIVYGLQIGSMPIIGGNATTVAFALILIALKWRQRQKENLRCS
jgi:MtN3 and saliva related transmembrane protein